MKRVISLLFLLIFANAFCTAQTVSSAGYSFKVPKGWKYQQDGDVVVLGSDTIAGMIVVYPHNFQNTKVLKSNMLMGIEDEGLYLQLASSLHKMGRSTLWGEYEGFYNMQPVKAKGYGILSSKGGGTIIIAMSTPDGFSKQLVHAADSVSKSLHYKKKKKSSQASSNVRSGDLMQRFAGEWVTMTKYSESHIYLYPNGTYVYNSESSYGNSDASVGAVWGAAQDSQNRGHWRVQGNWQRGQIIMTDANGETNSYPYAVHVENGQVYQSEYYFGEKLYFKK